MKLQDDVAKQMILEAITVKWGIYVSIRDMFGACKKAQITFYIYYIDYLCFI